MLGPVDSCGWFDIGSTVQDTNSTLYLNVDMSAVGIRGGDFRQEADYSGLLDDLVQTLDSRRHSDDHDLVTQWRHDC